MFNTAEYIIITYSIFIRATCFIENCSMGSAKICYKLPEVRQKDYVKPPNKKLHNRPKVYRTIYPKNKHEGINKLVQMTIKFVDPQSTLEKKVIEQF